MGVVAVSLATMTAYLAGLCCLLSERRGPVGENCLQFAGFLLALSTPPIAVFGSYWISTLFRGL